MPVCEASEEKNNEDNRKKCSATIAYSTARQHVADAVRHAGFASR